MKLIGTSLQLVYRYLFLVGMLMAQFTMTGFDACAHMSEETTGADKSAPTAIVISIAASFVAGLAYVLALTFSIQVSASTKCFMNMWCTSTVVHLNVQRCA